MTAERGHRIAALGYDFDGQPQEPVTTCNLCGADSFIALTSRDRYGFSARTAACRRCGLAFMNPRLTAGAYAAFYEQTYRPLVSAFHGRLIDARSIQAEQEEYARDRVRFMRPFVAGAGFTTLLDIGGSTGVVASRLGRAFGLTTTLIDPAPSEVEVARSMGLDTIVGLVEEHDFGDRRFDVVVICQTIDHLLDISGTLRRVRGLLTDAGRLFVDIVDFRASYLRAWSVEEATKIDHPYSLTQDTMEAYLRRSGFEIDCTDYAPEHLHVGYLCRPAAPRPSALPDPDSVSAFFRELRFVQNAPRPS